MEVADEDFFQYSIIYQSNKLTNTFTQMQNFYQQKTFDNSRELELVHIFMEFTRIVTTYINSWKDQVIENGYNLKDEGIQNINNVKQLENVVLEISFKSYYYMHFLLKKCFRVLSKVVGWTKVNNDSHIFITMTKRFANFKGNMISDSQMRRLVMDVNCIKTFSQVHTATHGSSQCKKMMHCLNFSDRDYCIICQESYKQRSFILFLHCDHNFHAICFIAFLKNANIEISRHQCLVCKRAYRFD